MLKSLHISNYALIESVDIDFVDGLNIITGETGAGKSILLGALGLILGARADLKAIRNPQKKTVVEAEFDISSYPGINDVLLANDIDTDDSVCILRREITSKGGSRAFINDTPVNLNIIREVAVRLIDIHSQHQNLLLADSAYQLSVIDTLAGNQQLLKQYSELYKAYRNALKNYTSTREMLTRSRDDAEYLSYQLAQIDELKLKPDEQSELERQREILANVNDIKSRLRNAIDAITSDNNVITAIRRSSEELSRLDEIYDEAPSLAARLNSASIEISDILDTLYDYDNTLLANPEELSEIESRLSAIYSLETRHHVENSDQLIELADKLRTQLNTINNGDEQLARLELEAKKAKKAAVILAREISARRMDAAADFVTELKNTATPLGLENLQFEIPFHATKLSPAGIDNIDFLFAFNKNQQLMTVGKTASGGEISRVILAIKAVVSEKMALPTIIFDEVDTGVSGDIANRMGRMMTNIADHTQVITITHLAQVASKGRRHFKVYKLDDDTSTRTHIDVLSQDERISEIALMISGNPENAGARSTAAEMLLSC